LKFGSAATLWRINLGWRRRKEKNQWGFVLDLERGYWAKNEMQEEDDPDDPMSARTKRVIPYVEDRRNCLIFEPKDPLDETVMASLQAALKNAIQVEYQLEDNELVAEPLPSKDRRKMILFYEAAEGGAGVLRRLLSDLEALPNVAQQALTLCHYDPGSGEDLRRAPRATEDCEAACYDCMMSYSNQLDHPLLDRAEIKDFLFTLMNSEVIESPVPKPRAEHLQDLRNRCDSDLEKRWLDFLETRSLHLPSHAQAFMEECNTRPDFLYQDQYVAIYIDGPVHEFEDRVKRDREKTECMEDLGYTVIRFAHDDEWPSLVDRYSSIFGKGS
jgi:very-short-patch-repair endonuclease